MCHFLVNIQQKLQCLVLTFLKHFLPPFSSLQLFALPSKGHDLLISINAQWVRSSGEQRAAVLKFQVVTYTF